MIVAVTGHRPDKLGGYKQPNPIANAVKHSLSLALDDLALEAGSSSNKHPGLHIISGMALGVDQWTVELCIKKGIPFTAAIPHTNQESKWPPHAQAVYHSLLKQAHQAYIISPGAYDAWKMHKRNEYMVDSCHLLLAAWDGSPGGTGACVTYAKQVGRQIRFIKLPTTGWTEPSFESNPPAAAWDPKTGIKLSVSPFVHSIKTKAEEKAAAQLALMKLEEKKFAEKLKAEKDKEKKKTALDVLKPLLVMPSPFPKTPTGDKLAKEQQSLAEEIFQKLVGAGATKELFGPPYTDSKKYTEQELQKKIADVFENLISTPKAASPFAWKKTGKEKEEQKEEPLGYGRKLDLDD